MDFHGNLPLERFGDLETTLARAERKTPISDGSRYGDDDISGIAQFTEWTDQCMVELLRQYPISTDIYHVRLWADFPNAFASGLYNGGYVICFYEALFPALLYASHHILMTPAVQHLLGIDQAGLPVAEKGSLRYAFVPPTASAVDFHDAAELMTLIAQRFIVCHEFQHLKAGHVDWLRQGAKGHLLMEAVGERQGAEDDFRRTLHALEMDADAFALVHCLYDATRMLEASEAGDNSLVGYLTRYDEALVKLVWLSIFMFFRVMDNGLLQRFDIPFVRSHPNGANRGALLGLSGGEYLKASHRPAMRQINWPRLGGDVLWCCELGLSYLAGIEPNIDRLKPTVGYLDLLLSRWAKIRPALDLVKLTGQLIEPCRAPG